MSEVSDGGGSVPDDDRGGAVQQEGARQEQTGADRQAVSTPAADPVVELAKSVSELGEQVRAYHSRAQARERVIDQLHGELERLRGGEQALILRPVVTDLQRLRADLLYQATTLSPETDQKQAAALLESFALSVEQALERCGSLPIRPPVGAEFSAREHRAVKLVAASGPEEDNTIAMVVADGYLDAGSGRVTLPARVYVRRWTAPQVPPQVGPGAADDASASERQENDADV